MTLPASLRQMHREHNLPPYGNDIVTVPASLRQWYCGGAGLVTAVALWQCQLFNGGGTWALPAFIRSVSVAVTASSRFVENLFERLQSSLSSGRNNTASGKTTDNSRENVISISLSGMFDIYNFAKCLMDFDVV